MPCLQACVRETQARQGRIGGLVVIIQSLSRVYSLWPHGLQHTRTPCSSPPPGVHPSSCPLSQWCHPSHLIFCCPLLLLPSVFPRIRVFSDELALSIRWPKYIFNFEQNYFQEIKSLCMVRLAPKELHGDKIFKQLPWKQRFFELPGALIQKFQFFSTAQFFKCHFASSLSLDSRTQHSVILGVYWPEVKLGWGLAQEMKLLWKVS